MVLAALTACHRSPDDGVGYPDPSRWPVRGIDISSHNGQIDFERVAADSVHFVYAKATEGATFKDARFVDNVRRASAAGLKVGAYHFFRFDTPGYMQGLNFLNSVEGRPLDLPLAIDFEEWTNPTNHPREQVRDNLRHMIDYLEKHGWPVIIYTNGNGYRRYIAGEFDQYDVWICSLVDEPGIDDWRLWQGTHNGRVDGVDTPVDVNAFSGDGADWLRWSNRLSKK